MTPDPTDDRRDRPADDPEFDARRSAEIRALLIRTVAGTPRPRRARLSRPAFALAATAALLFAGGVGAGTVLTVDRFTDPLVAQDASASESVEAASDLSGQSSSVQAMAASESAADSDLHQTRSDGLTPVLTINGETGYAYPRDIDLARTTCLWAPPQTFSMLYPSGRFRSIWPTASPSSATSTRRGCSHDTPVDGRDRADGLRRAAWRMCRDDCDYLGHIGTAGSYRPVRLWHSGEPGSGADRRRRDRLPAGHRAERGLHHPGPRNDPDLRTALNRRKRSGPAVRHDGGRT